MFVRKYYTTYPRRERKKPRVVYDTAMMGNIRLHYSIHNGKDRPFFSSSAAPGHLAYR